MSHRFRLITSIGAVLLGAPFANAQQNVAWTNIVNATASGSTLTKTGGCDGCQDAGGVTHQRIVRGTGSFQFSLGTGQEVYAGLTHTTVTPLVDTTLDYAFVIYQNDSCEIRELGDWKADCAFTAGDVLKVSIEPGPVVKYYRNGAAIYASATVPSSYPLFSEPTSSAPVRSLPTPR